MEASEIERWQNEVLPHVTRDQPLPDGLVGDLALLSADTDRTHDYVFQSGRLPEIRGASMRLDGLNQKGLLRLLQEKHLPTAYLDSTPPGCLIFNGGGSLLALVPGALAGTLVDEIEALYPQESGTATITAVWQPITIEEARGILPDSLSDQALAELFGQLAPAQQERFQDSLGVTQVQRLLRHQALALRWRKQAKRAIPHFETNPFTRLCSSCGRRPTTTILSGITGETSRSLCQVCCANDRLGRKRKSIWNTRFEAWCLETKQQTVSTPKTEKLESIGASSRGYIGFIYADGDSIGRWLGGSESLVAYSRLSQRLSQVTATAVYQALYNHLYDQGTAQVLPFEIITVGGDDVLLIVPAHTALPIAHDICHEFSRQLVGNGGQEEAPTMSAGVVLAKDSNPIYFLSDLANKLLRSAKQKSRRTGAACLDFMVLKSQSMLATDLGDVRRSALMQVEHEQNKERCLLTARPYSLAEVGRLLAGTRRLKRINFSPGQLHQMQREFQRGRLPGLFYYLYQRTRLERISAQNGVTLRNVEADWGMVGPDDAPPWRPVPTKPGDGFVEYDTPFLDMLALLEFID